MGCAICGRQNCLPSFHSIEAQEAHDAEKEKAMKPRTITVTKEIEVGCDENGFFLSVEGKPDQEGYATIEMTSFALRMLRDATGELLEEEE